MADDRNASYSLGGIDKAVDTAAGDAYLGDPQVVDGLVRAFVNDLIDAQASKDGEELKQAIIGAATKTALVFAGADAKYQAMPNWNNHGALGAAVSARMSIDPSQSLVDILSAAFGMMAINLAPVFALAAEDKPEEEWGWMLDAEVEFMSSLMLGTIDITHPPELAAPNT